MRFNSVGFALSAGMASIVVLIGFTLLSAAGLVGFAAEDLVAGPPQAFGCGVGDDIPLVATNTAAKLASISPKEAKLVAAGEGLFKGNCAQCHGINEQVVGPALVGITKRRPVAWILPWVKNSSKVVASGDEYAVSLFNKFNKQQMPSFTLSNQEITFIIAYINSQEGHATMAVVYE